MTYLNQYFRTTDDTSLCSYHVNMENENAVQIEVETTRRIIVSRKWIFVVSGKSLRKVVPVNPAKEVSHENENSSRAN